MVCGLLSDVFSISDNLVSNNGKFERTWREADLAYFVVYGLS
jgi:hypothetical protein